MNFSEAYSHLTELVSQLEDERIQLDSLAEKVKQARELIEYCEKKLRMIEGEINN